MNIIKHTLLLTGMIMGGSALAAPGHYEINQACLDVGCFIGDDPSTRTVEITLRSGTFVLTSDIFVGLNDPKAIAIDNSSGLRQAITLDLNGFQIRHESGQTVDAISVAGNNSFVTIKNGSITGFNNGIESTQGPTLHVENMLFRLMDDDAIEIAAGKVINNHFDCNDYGVFALDQTATLEGDRVWLEGNVFSCGISSADRPVFSFGANNVCKDNMITYDANINTNFGSCRLVGTNICDGLVCTQGNFAEDETAVKE